MRRSGRSPGGTLGTSREPSCWRGLSSSAIEARLKSGALVIAYWGVYALARRARTRRP